MANGGSDHGFGWQFLQHVALVLSSAVGVASVTGKIVSAMLDARLAKLERNLLDELGRKFMSKELADARYVDLTDRITRAESRIEKFHGHNH